VLDDARAYWLANDKLVSVRKDGTDRTELTIPNFRQVDPGALRDGGDAIVVASHGCFFVAKIPKNGSPAQVWPVTQHAAAGGVTGLTVDGSAYYCASGAYVYRLDSSTGQVTELIQNGRYAGPMTKVGADLYWIDFGPPDTNAPALETLAAGATQSSSLAPAYGEVGSLMFDAKRMSLYWITGLATHGCDAVVYDLQAKRTTFLARDLNEMGDTAMDDDYVYWSAYNAVMRVPK
jgi:hypothetical protein